MPVNRLYTQLSELPVVEAADITTPTEDGLFCNVDGVDSYVPFNELDALGGLPALEARVTTAEADINTVEASILALRNGILAVYVDDFGATADGTTTLVTAPHIAAHPEWVGTYTIGVHSLDYIAWQEAIYKAFYNGTLVPNGLANAHLNRPIICGNGKYNITHTIFGAYLVGSSIRGMGRFATQLRMVSANISLFGTNGASGVKFYDMLMEATANQDATHAVVDLNWDNTAGGNALQSNEFHNVYFRGSGATVQIGVNIARDGFMGSENLFYDCFAEGFSVAAYKSSAANALQNTILKGNIQACRKYGIWAFAGNWVVDDVGMQNADEGGAGQLDNAGWDFYGENSAYDGSRLTNIRTESIKFARATNQHFLYIDNVKQVTPLYRVWTAATVYALGTVITDTNGRPWRVTTAGTSGGAEPVWPGTVYVLNAGTTQVDNTVTWTAIDVNVVEHSGATIIGSSFQLGRIKAEGTTAASQPISYIANKFTRTDWLRAEDNAFFSTAGSSSTIFGNWVENVSGTNRVHSLSGFYVNGTYRTEFNIGTQPIVSSDGGRNIAIVRSGTANDAGKEVEATWRIYGGLEPHKFAFADRGAPPNGTMGYCTDGTKGSDPLTGGGTGCFAGIENGVWRSL
jgi:hypothetical protein